MENLKLFGQGLISDFRGESVNLDSWHSFYVCNKRFYNSVAKTFLTPDSFYLESPEECIKNPVSCNLFSYADNDPVAKIDPDGRTPFSILTTINIIADAIFPTSIGGGGVKDLNRHLANELTNKLENQNRGIPTNMSSVKDHNLSSALDNMKNLGETAITMADKTPFSAMYNASIGKVGGFLGTIDKIDRMGSLRGSPSSEDFQTLDYLRDSINKIDNHNNSTGPKQDLDLSHEK